MGSGSSHPLPVETWVRECLVYDINGEENVDGSDAPLPSPFPLSPPIFSSYSSPSPAPPPPHPSHLDLVLDMRPPCVLFFVLVSWLIVL